MKNMKQRISWLLIASMLAGSASFPAMADDWDDDEYEEEEILLINDLFRSGGNSRSRERSGKIAPDVTIEWNDTATPSVTKKVFEGKGTDYYANGNAVVITASGSNTYLVEKNGAYTKIEDPASSVIYGGSGYTATSSNAVKSTDITLLSTADGEQIQMIIGGNRDGGSLENVSVKVLGGKVGVLYANTGSHKDLYADISGADSYASRENYSVSSANVEAYGGGIGILSGTAGYTYIKDLDIYVNGATIGNYSSAPTDLNGIFLGGANGQVNNAKLTLDGGKVSKISTGQRAHVGTATYNLNQGQVKEIYAGTFYPDNEKASGYTDGSSINYGWVHYGNANTVDIKIGEALSYQGLFAGFHLLDSERKAILSPLDSGTSSWNFIKSEYYTDFNPKVSLQIAAAPKGNYSDSWYADHDLIAHLYDTKAEFAKYLKTKTLPTLKVTNGTVTFENNAVVASGSNASWSVLPGTGITVTAGEKADQKFSSWKAENLYLHSDQVKAKELTFDMPVGLYGVTLEAVYVDKGISLDAESLKLDLNQKKDLSSDSITVEDSDYEQQDITVSYDKDIIDVSLASASDWSYEVTAKAEGETEILFGLSGSSKTLAKVPVTVVNTTPWLEVIDASIVSVDGQSVSGNKLRVNEGSEVILAPLTIPDKKFVAWDYSIADNLLTMPDKDLKVRALYEDKSFMLDPETDQVTLNLDQTETNTEKLPSEYSFAMITDYALDQVESSDKKVASVKYDPETDRFIITAQSPGFCTITLYAFNDSNKQLTASIDVTVTDTSKKLSTDAGAAVVKSNVDATVVINEALDKLPGSVTKEEKAEIGEKVTEVQETAVNSITNNAAVKNASTQGFNRPDNLKDYKLPQGVDLEIYPKQTLNDMKMGFDTVTRTVTKTVTETDPTTGKQVEKTVTETITEYTPVITSITYDITPFARVKNKDQETELSGLKGSFRFRIPVPAGISKRANLARVQHENDPVRSYPIREENGHKFVEIRVSHFSAFTLYFDEANVSYGGGSGSSSDDGGGSYTGAKTGSWVLDQVGWWYRYSDSSYPVNAWLYVSGAANGVQWYHFDAIGYMQTGWFTDVDGHRYYLHPISDGSKGYMYTGWHEIDGKWYYFTETKTQTNPVGSLQVQTTTPDGHVVDANGVRIS